MDDIRVFLFALECGWRWLEDEFYFCDEWESEDQQAGKSENLRTAEQLVKAMDNIMEFLTSHWRFLKIFLE